MLIAKKRENKMGKLKLLSFLFFNRKKLLAIVDSIKTVIVNIREEESSGGKDITKEELLTLLNQIEKSLAELQSLIG